MFESQNFFKSILCPFISSSVNCSNSNNLNNACERPYCQFSHCLIENNSSLEQENLIQSNSSTKTKLPDALANLSSALQAVQDLIKQNRNDDSKNADATAASASTASLSSVMNQLSSLSSTLLTSKTAETSRTTASKQKKTINEFKRQQMEAPAYNPTPLNVLKNIPKVEEIEIVDLSSSDDLNEEPEPKKRKTPLSTPSQDCGSAKTNICSLLDFQEAKNSDILSSKPGISSPSDTKSGGAAKIDLLSFSKLTAKQQLLKRYEIMKNKPAPTANKLREAKLKKQAELQSKHDGSRSSLPSHSTTAPLQQTPRLLMEPGDQLSNKVPIVVRQRNLKFVFDNVRALYSLPKQLDEACKRASEEEKTAYDRAKNKTIYMNLIANLVKNIRAEISLKQPQQHTKLVNNPNKIINIQPGLKQSVSHEAMLSGPKAARVSYSINKTKQVEIKDLTESQLYQLFATFLLNEKQLDENSFPKWISSGSLAHIPNFSSQSKNISDKFGEKAAANAEKYKLDNRKSNSLTISSLAQSAASSIQTKVCKRCSSLFYVDSAQMMYLKSNSECVYHWGKLRNVRFNKLVEQKYSCCSGGPGSEGCEVGAHVYDGEYDGHGTGTNLSGYVEACSSGSAHDTRIASNVYALDCEMCYTTKGLELVRISVIDINFNEKYETLVRPEGQILDYNTRWSGITKDMLENCTKSLQHVQQDLLALLDRNTILIGHSLESDFKALKLIHKSVVDTSVVFPHKMGAPYKRALRNLMSEYLQKIIQEDAVGHDSKEDAAACVQLMLWKIGEDLKTKKFQSLISNWSSLTMIQEVSSTALLGTRLSVHVQNENTPTLDELNKKGKQESSGTASHENKTSAKSSSSATSTKSLFVMNRATSQLLQKISTFSK